MWCDCEEGESFLQKQSCFFATGRALYGKFISPFVLIVSAYLCVYPCVCVLVFLSHALCPPGKTHRFQSLRGAVKKNAAFLRKACASVCMSNTS